MEERFKKQKTFIFSLHCHVYIDVSYLFVLMCDAYLSFRAPSDEPVGAKRFIAEVRMTWEQRLYKCSRTIRRCMICRHVWKKLFRIESTDGRPSVSRMARCHHIGAVLGRTAEVSTIICYYSCVQDVLDIPEEPPLPSKKKKKKLWHFPKLSGSGQNPKLSLDTTVFGACEYWHWW